MIAQQSAFEVASIKVSDGGIKMPMTMSVNPGGITFTNVTTMDCIAAAFGMKDYQVSGPDWLKSDRYVIAARTSAPANDDQLKAMLRTLLADRFKLTVHRETKDLAVYAITPSKGGARLRATQGGPENNLSFQAGKLAFRNYSMAGLAKFLSSLPSLDRPIVDATELQGGYDFDVGVDAESSDPVAIKRAMLDWSSMFVSLERQVGLKVEARKGPADFIIVDHIEKPAPN